MSEMADAPIVEGEVKAGGRKVAVVAARFNDFIVSSLLKGATASWLERGGAAEDLLVARVPGASEAIRRISTTLLASAPAA
jgi:6,7-dimethyl-8-ribityllumazine synthase